jgi:hypothetical protein
MPLHPRQWQTGRKAGTQSQGPGNTRKPGCRKGESRFSVSDDEGVVFFQNWDPERMPQAGDGRKTNAMLEGTRKDSGRSPAVNNH